MSPGVLRPPPHCGLLREGSRVQWAAPVHRLGPLPTRSLFPPLTGGGGQQAAWPVPGRRDLGRRPCVLGQELGVVPLKGEFHDPCLCSVMTGPAVGGQASCPRGCLISWKALRSEVRPGRSLGEARLLGFREVLLTQQENQQTRRCVPACKCVCVYMCQIGITALRGKLVVQDVQVIPHF